MGSDIISRYKGARIELNLWDTRSVSLKIDKLLGDVSKKTKLDLPLKK